MTLAALIVFVVAVLAIAGLHAWSLLRTLDRQRKQDEADEGRRQAIYQQQKASQREIAKLQRTVEIFAEKSHGLHDDARLMHARVNGFFSDRRVQHWLDQGVSGREPDKEMTGDG